MPEVLNHSSALIDVARLKQHPENPRRGDLKAVEASIKANGFFGAIVAQTSTKFVLAGNHRLQAAKNLGIERVPVIWVDVDDAKAKRILLADNRTSDTATYDDQALHDLLTSLAETEDELTGTGYDTDDLNALTAMLDGKTGRPEPREPDTSKADELLKKWKVEPGQIWAAGPHRLGCIDCITEGDLERLMGDEFGKAHLLVTDPPYNVDYVGGSMSYTGAQPPRHRIANDALGTKFPAFCEAFAIRFRQALRPGGIMYVFMSSSEWPAIDASLRNAGHHWSTTIIWRKHRISMTRRDYHSQYEPIWYGWDGRGARHHPVEDRSSSDVWDFDRPASSELHPTQKPVEVLSRMIENSSGPGELVIDLFGGSFSTMVAADSLGRRCISCDLEPRFVAVGLEEMAHRGHEPELVSG